MRHVPAGEAHLAHGSDEHQAKDTADALHQIRRAKILEWIAELPDTERQKVEQMFDSMRGAVPRPLWSRSLLARDAALKAYLAVVGSLPT